MKPSKPYLTIPLTTDCQFRCRYCPPGGESYRSKTRFIQYDQAIPFISALGAGDTIKFTGGDPFLHPDWYIFIAESKSRRIRTNINTNGVALGRYMDELIELQPDEIRIGLDTLNRDTFRKITGRDLFDQVYQNIVATKESGLPIRLNVVLSKFNESEMPAIIDFCIENCFGLKILDMYPVTENYQDWKELFVPSSRIVEFLEQCADDISDVEYTKQFGIPMKQFRIRDTIIHVKDTSIGKNHYHSLCAGGCDYYPCQEAFYCPTLSVESRINVCRPNPELFYPVFEDLSPIEQIERIYQLYAELKSEEHRCFVTKPGFVFDVNKQEERAIL